VTLFVCSWLWGEKWPSVYVERLFAGVARNLRQDFRSVLITDQVGYAGADIVCQIAACRPSIVGSAGLPGANADVRSDMAGEIGARKGDRIVCIDVDAVITGRLDPLFDRDDEFTIMQGFNQTNPCPFNGSLWMFRAGERHDVWIDFRYRRASQIQGANPLIADDQGWLHFKFPHAKAYTPRDGVYAFKKIGWGEAGGAVFRTMRGSSRFPAAILQNIRT
jgi:hypothetical protein